MEFEQLTERYQKHYEKLRSTIADSLKQLFSREIKVELKGTELLESGTALIEEGASIIQILFLTKGPHNYRHTIVFSTEIGLKFFAWLTQTEADEAFTEEHIKGLTEGSNQIIGQLQAALEGDPDAFVVDELQITVSETSEKNTSKVEEQQGLLATYEISNDDETISVQHQAWLIAEEKTETDEEDQPSEGEGQTEDQEVADGDQEPGVTESDEESSAGLVGVHPADFEMLDEDGSTNGKPRNLDMLYDVGLEVLVELGKKSMVIRDILKLGKGSIIELEKAAGDPLEIFVNGRKLAEGEVVVVDDHFGIRITQLAGPKERIQNLV